MLLLSLSLSLARGSEGERSMLYVRGGSKRAARSFKCLLPARGVDRVTRSKFIARENRPVIFSSPLRQVFFVKRDLCCTCVFESSSLSFRSKWNGGSFLFLMLHNCWGSARDDRFFEFILYFSRSIDWIPGRELTFALA